MKKHNYTIKVEWTGNEGKGTSDYSSYSRNHLIAGFDKYNDIKGSSDPAFRGDPSRYSPEDLFLSTLSTCHMLWYLHLCSTHDIVVISYIDQATGIMEEAKDGSGKFVSVTLRPNIKIQKAAKIELAHQLHQTANRMCFIANSCNFEIKHEAIISC
ncbi:MAG: OsmC family protein [Bacteroidota bacterium]